MDPFDDGMIAADGFHAISSLSESSSGNRSRICNGQEYPFFYNPMWNFLGDRSPGKPGTYWYRSGQINEYFWHMFDQVILRPSIAKLVDFHDISIIGGDGEEQFSDANGRPDKDKISDHYPIVFSLRRELKQEV